MKKIIIYLMLISSFNCYSQIKYEIFGGINIHDRDTFEKKLIGFQSGVSLYININKDWYFRPSLGLKNLRSKEENIPRWTSEGQLDYIVNTKINYLYSEIPLLIGYKILRNNSFDLNFEGGWFISYGIGGKIKGTLNYPNKQAVPFNEGTFLADNKFNLGPIVAISSVIKKHYLIRASGEWEITDNGYYRKYQTYSLSLGYLF